MNFKTTYILFGLLAGVLVVFGLTQLLGVQSPKDDSVWVFNSLNDRKNPISSSDIESVEIEHSSAQPQKLIFSRNDQGWQLQEPKVRVDGYAVDRVIDQVKGARKEQKADVTSDLKQFGLDAPRTIVTLKKKGEDKEWKLNIGNESEGSEFEKVVYVTTSERPHEPMAVKRSELDTVFKDLNSFRSKSLLADSAFDITYLSAHEPKHDPVVLEKNSEGHWRFQKPDYGEADYDGELTGTAVTTGDRPITGVRDLLQGVADIKVDTDKDFGPTDVADAKLAEMGLEPGKEKLKLEVKHTAGFGADKKEPVEAALYIGNKADDKGEKLYARLENEHSVEMVPAKKVEAVLKALEKPAALRNRDLVQVESSKVDAIDIKVANDTPIKLRQTGTLSSWKLYDAGKARDTDGGAVQSLLSALTTKREVKDFPEASKTDAALGLDKPTAVVSLWVEGIKKDEKKDEAKDEKKDEAKDEKKDEAKEGKKDEKKDDKKADAKKEEKKDPNAEPKLKEEKPTVRLVFGKKDKDLVYVRREAGKDVIRLAVPASLLDKVSEDRLAYLDRRLPAFGSQSDVTKIVLTRGGQTFEMDRVKDDKNPNPWKMVQPKEMAGRSAESTKVDRLLSTLSGLQAEKIVAEKTTPADLDRYGLAAPAVKVVLTVTKSDKKTEDHTYLFGKEAADKSRLYAKQSDRDVVFEVQKSVIDSLEGDVRDPVVVRFDLNKLRGMKLVGWQEVIGSPFTLELERTGAQSWKSRLPVDFKVDSAKAEALASSLTGLHADRFLGKVPIKPEYRLEINRGGLDLTLTVEGEKEPITITIGGEADPGSYYARSNKLPGEVFVVGKGLLEQVKNRPAYLKQE
jgi:Domain of unknown function (DUF4340)